MNKWRQLLPTLAYPVGQASAAPSAHRGYALTLALSEQFDAGQPIAQASNLFEEGPFEAGLFGGSNLSAAVLFHQAQTAKLLLACPDTMLLAPWTRPNFRIGT